MKAFRGVLAVAIPALIFTVVFWAPRSQAMIFEEIESTVQRDSLRPPQEAIATARENDKINGVSARIGYYRSAMTPEKLVAFYRSQAPGRGWRELVRADLLGAMTGLTGGPRDAASPYLFLTAFVKGEHKVVLGIFSNKAEQSNFMVAAADGRFKEEDKPESEDPLSILQGTGARKIVFEIREYPAGARPFVSVYSMPGTVAQAKTTLMRRLETSHWRYQPGEKEGVWLILEKGDVRGVAVLCEDAASQTRVAVWGEIK